MPHIATYLGLALSVVLLGCGPSSNEYADAGSNASVDADPNRSDAIPPPTNAAVYAHSSSTLYRVNPDTLQVTMVSDFGWPTGSDQMTDIAIDKDGNMIGISYGKVYAVNKDNGICTFLANLTGSFNGLSFVPATGPDPGDNEILIAAGTTDGLVYQLDPMTGQSTQVGQYGNGIRSSGDIVSVRGFGTVATVKQSALDATDKLARIDPTTFAATIIGDTGVADIWGLGFWKNKVYGFTDNKRFVLIDVTTGLATEVEMSVPNWWGAGVTTTAPVIE